MKKIKILISIVLIIFLVLFVILLVVKNKTVKKTESVEKEENIALEANLELEETNSLPEFQNAENCINTYLNYLKENNGEAIKSILIKDSSNDDININFNFDYKIDKIFKYESNLDITTYFVYGKLINTDIKESKECNFVVNIDILNKTFEISLLNNVYSKYIDYSDIYNLKISEKIQQVIDYINPNDYNKINYIFGLGDKEIMTFYFKEFIKNAIYDTEKAYELLDKNYKEKRFGNLENFKEYVKKYQEDLEKSFTVKYKVKQYDDFKEYLCKDNYENYYIFKESEPKNYTVMLDQYTIKDKMFVENYNKQEKVNKAQMNLNLFKQMLNRGDYTSAYGVLNKEFKEKYFDTEKKFVEYISNNLYKYNDFSYMDLESEETKYKITTKISNMQNSFRENTIKRFKVQLLDEGSFSISFDI